MTINFDYTIKYRPDEAGVRREPLTLRDRSLGAAIENTQPVLRYADLSDRDLRGAWLSDRFDLTGALFTGASLAGANLSLSCLTDADLYAADLRRAVLHGATLRGARITETRFDHANLSRTDFRGAMAHADVISRLLARVVRMFDGYEFFLFQLENGEARVKAGCRWMSIPDYVKHTETYGERNDPDDGEGEEKRAQTLRILDYFTDVLGGFGPRS